jgi:hypothetical protein
LKRARTIKRRTMRKKKRNRLPADQKTKFGRS